VSGAGPSALQPTARALVIGARPQLIAFSMERDTPVLRLARRIAKEVRESSGGLPAVQAKCFMLSNPGRVQVSVNLLAHTVTSLPTVWRAVEARASAEGVRVLRGELIGLLPPDAALVAVGTALRLDGFGRAQVIEAHFLE